MTESKKSMGNHDFSFMLQYVVDSLLIELILKNKI